MIIPVNGCYPKIHSSSWIAPNATITGEVEIGKKCSVWFNTVIRGDVFAIKIGDETNIQDSSVLHATYKKCGLTIGSRVSVGHSVILHGCTVDDLTLIGMGTIVMDQAHVPSRCIVGAGSLVTEGSSFEEGMLILGRPAKAVRKLKKEELEFLEKSAANYIQYTTWYAGQGGKIP